MMMGKGGKGPSKSPWAPRGPAAIWKGLYGPKGGCGGFGGDPWGAADPWGGLGGEVEKGAVAEGGVIWVNVGDNALTQSGYPADAPALVYEKGPNIFSSSAFVLSDIVGDIDVEVEIVHDEDWVQYPEIGQAVKAATGEDHCFAIACCANQAKWGIGLAGGKKGRESAAKLALAVAIASEDPMLAGRLSSSYPEFGAILRKQGVAVAAGGGGAAWKSGGGGGGGATSGGGPPPTIHFITLTQESQLTEGGYPAEAPAIAHGGKHSKEFFSNAHSILSDLVPDISEVAFEEDTEWTVLPEVGAALTAAGADENSFAVATCPSLAVWGVGLGGKAARTSASKLALAVAIAQTSGRLDEMSAKYPEFGETLAAAGLVQKAAKKRSAPGMGKGGGGGAKGKGGAAAAAAAAAAAPVGGGGAPAPKIHFITLTQESQLTEGGYPAEAPAIAHGGKHGKEFFSNAHSILSDLVPDVSEVAYEEDTEWTVLPEVGAALTAAGADENSFTVATCPSMAVWGVGIGGKPFRQSASKLALAVALAQAAGRLDEFSAKYPEFGEVLAGAGLVQPGAKKARGAPAGGGAPVAAAAGAASGGAPTVHFITLTQESQLTSGGYPAEAPAIAHGGKHSKEYFSNAYSILSELVEDVSEVTYEDDLEWTVLPEVGAAMTAAGVPENSFMVATCPSMAAWGVGVGGKAARTSACKLALAIAIAQASGRVEEFGSKYPEFGEVCAGAGLMQPVKKSRKGGF